MDLKKINILCVRLCVIAAIGLIAVGYFVDDSKHYPSIVIAHAILYGIPLIGLYTISCLSFFYAVFTNNIPDPTLEPLLDRLAFLARSTMVVLTVFVIGLLMIYEHMEAESGKSAAYLMSIFPIPIFFLHLLFIIQQKKYRIVCVVYSLLILLALAGLSSGSRAFLMEILR